MARVTIQDLLTAAEWLDIYEDDGSDGYNEAEGCYRVAEWLRQEADRRIKENAVEKAVRDMAKEHPHVSKRIMRKRLRELLKTDAGENSN